MNQTRIEYIQEQQRELIAEGMKPYEIEGLNFDDEYYALVESHIKQGNTITNEIYHSLTQGQQYHFNKHHNPRGDKVINSDYSQAIESAQEQSKINYDRYLEEQKQRQQENDIQDLKEREISIKRLNEEIKQLENNLFDYEKLNAIGKRNIRRADHEQKQQEIQQKILELREQIKRLN